MMSFARKKGTDPAASRRAFASGGERRGVDLFFLFTCTLLVLAVALQVVLIVWMDIF